MQGDPFKNPFSTTLAGTANSCKVHPSVVLWARLCAAASAELVRTVGSWLVFPAALAHWNFRDFCFLGWSCRGSCFVIVRPFLLSASPLTVWRATIARPAAVCPSARELFWELLPLVCLLFLAQGLSGEAALALPLPALRHHRCYSIRKTTRAFHRRPGCLPAIFFCI